VKEAPEEYAQAVIAAADQSKGLIRHLRMIVSSLSTVEEGLTAAGGDIRALLATAFEHFVERILISDFRALKTHNNPFRFRLRILEYVDELLQDPVKIHRIAQGLVAQGAAPTVDIGESMVRQRLDTVRSAFNGIGPHLERVEVFILKLEQRIATTVRHLDREVSDETTDVVPIIRALIDLERENPATSLPFERLSDLRPWDQSALHPPRRTAAVPPATRRRRAKPTPEQIAYERRCDAYLESFDISQPDAVRIARRLIGGATIAALDQSRITTVSDFIQVDALRTLAAHDAHPGKPLPLGDGLEIRLTGEWESGEWFTGRRIVLRRVADERD